jgi:hypothetical protein
MCSSSVFEFEYRTTSLFRHSTAATIAVICNALEWIQTMNHAAPLAVICDTTDAQGSSSM